MAMKQTTEHLELEVVSLLVQAADADTVYRDLYLERASLHLAKVFPEAEYRQLGAGQARIDALLHQTQAAVRREDWAKVSELSAEADGLRRTMQAKAATMKLAASVYDAPPVAADPFSPGLTALSLVKGATPAALRESLIAVFDKLAKADPECSELYSERRSRFDQLVVASGAAKAEKSGKEGTDLDELRRRAREAAERGDFAQLQSLADEIVRTSAAQASAARRKRSNRLRLPESADTPSPPSRFRRSVSIVRRCSASSICASSPASRRSQTRCTNSRPSISGAPTRPRTSWPARAPSTARPARRAGCAEGSPHAVRRGRGAVRDPALHQLWRLSLFSDRPE